MVLLGRISTSDPKLVKRAMSKVSSPTWMPTYTILSHSLGTLYGLRSISCQQAATLALVKAESASGCQDAAGCHNQTHLPVRSKLHHQPPQVLCILRHLSTDILSCHHYRRIVSYPLQRQPGQAPHRLLSSPTVSTS